MISSTRWPSSTAPGSRPERRAELLGTAPTSRPARVGGCRGGGGGGGGGGSPLCVDLAVNDGPVCGVNVLVVVSRSAHLIFCSRFAPLA